LRALAYRAPKSLELVELEDPHAAEGQVVVEVGSCGICGSDLHSYNHGVAAEPGQVLGHEFAGTIVESGTEGIALGDRVTVRPLLPCGQCRNCIDGMPQLCSAGRQMNIGYGLRGAFAERVLVPRAVLGETVFHLPVSVDDRAGALVEPLSVGLHAVRMAGKVQDAVVVILGAGMIGLAAARFAKLGGAKTLIVVDPSALRRDAATRLGAHVVIDPDNEKVSDAVAEVTGRGHFGLGAAADAVIDCAGVASAFTEGLKCVRHGGTISLAATFGSKIEFNPTRIVEKELRLQGAFAYKDEFPVAIAALASGEVDPSLFVSHSFRLDEFDRAFHTQLNRDESLKVLITP
jgi:2-desacetyl-2-hydroxyethyl bacteriochlorophyllide A dehydrogenase